MATRVQAARTRNSAMGEPRASSYSRSASSSSVASSGPRASASSATGTRRSSDRGSSGAVAAAPRTRRPVSSAQKMHSNQQHLQSRRVTAALHEELSPRTDISGVSDDDGVSTLGDLSSVTASRNASVVDASDPVYGSIAAVPSRRGGALQAVSARASSRFEGVRAYVQRSRKISVKVFRQLLKDCNVHCDEETVFQLWSRAVNDDPDLAHAPHDRVAEVIVQAGGCVPRDPVSTSTVTNNSAASVASSSRLREVHRNEPVSAAGVMAPKEDNDDESSSLRIPESRRLTTSQMSPTRRASRPADTRAATPPRQRRASPSSARAGSAQRPPMRFGTPTNPRDRDPEQRSVHVRKTGGENSSPSRIVVHAQPGQRGFSVASKIRLTRAEQDAMVQSLYKRGLSKRLEREQVTRRKEEERREEETKGCTFKPLVRPRSRELSKVYLAADATVESQRYTRPTEASFQRESQVERFRATAHERRGRGLDPSPARRAGSPASASGASPARTARPGPIRRANSARRRDDFEEQASRYDPECTFAPKINSTPPSIRHRSLSPTPKGFYEAVCRMRATPPRAPSPAEYFERSLRCSPPRTPAKDLRKPEVREHSPRPKSTFGFDRDVSPLAERLSLNSVSEPVASERSTARVVRCGPKLEACVHEALETLREIVHGPDPVSEISTLADSAVNVSMTSTFAPLPKSAKLLLTEWVDEGRLAPDDVHLAKQALELLQVAGLVRNHSHDEIESRRMHERMVTSKRRAQSQSPRKEQPHYATPLRRLTHAPIIL